MKKSEKELLVHSAVGLVGGLFGAAGVLLIAADCYVIGIECLIELAVLFALWLAWESRMDCGAMDAQELADDLQVGQMAFDEWRRVRGKS